MGPKYTFVLDMCLLPKKGYSYIEVQSVCMNKAYTYEFNLIGDVLSMALVMHT